MYCPGNVHWAHLEASALGAYAACPTWKKRKMVPKISIIWGNALDILCAQLTCNLFVIAKFLFFSELYNKTRLGVFFSEHTVCLYLVPFLTYSALNNGVTLKSAFGSFKVIETSTIQKLEYGFVFTFIINYGYILYRF